MLLLPGNWGMKYQTISYGAPDADSPCPSAAAIGMENSNEAMIKLKKTAFFIGILLL